MPEPTKHPDWATDGTNTVEPPAGKVTAGWVPGEQPPAGWFNWWQNLVGLWTRWHEERIDALEAGQGGLAGDAALKSQANTFLKTQTINPAQVWEPLLKSERLATDGDEPAATWRMLLELPLLTGIYARAYYGTGTAGDGNFCITINAQYSADTANKWYADDDDYDASVMFMRPNLVRFALQPAGTASWLTWPQGCGLEAGGLTFVTPRTHVTRKGVWGGFGHGVIADTLPGDTPCVQLVTAGDIHSWPIQLPHESKLTKIEIFVKKAGGATMGPSGPGFASFISRAANLVPPPAPLWADYPLAYNTATSASGELTLEINIGASSDDIDLAATEYCIRVKAADAGDKIYGFQLTWSEASVQCYGG